MLKTRKLVSFVLVVALVISMGIVGIVSTSAADGTFYLTGSFNGWGEDDAYAFSENGDNPGEYMLMGVSLSAGDTFKVRSGDNWYPDGMGNDASVEESGTYNVYFNPNKNPEWTANSGYCYLELAGEPSDDPTQGGDDPIVGTMTVNFKDTNGWGSVNAYSWPAGGSNPNWPGEPATDNGDGTFSATIPSGYNVIFNSGDNQTVDIEGAADGDTYELTGEQDEQGHYFVQLAQDTPIQTDAPTEEVTDAPVVTDAPTDAPIATDAPVEGNNGKVKIDGKTFDIHVGDKIHFEYLIDMTGVPSDATLGKPGKITEFEATLNYDGTKLKLLTDTEVIVDDETGVASCEFLPRIKSGNIIVSNNDADTAKASVGYNAVQLSGYNFTGKKVLAHADFEVIAAGESEITNILTNLGSGDVHVVFLNEVKEEFGSEITAEVECPHGQPTEPVTDKPTDEKPTTSGDKAVVTLIDWSGKTETREFKVGDTFTVLSYLQVPEGKRVNSINVWQIFNDGDAIVELTSDVDAVDDPEAENPKSIMFPNIRGLTANVEGNTIKANGSAAKYAGSMRFNNEDSILIKSDYKVVANGATNIKTDIITMATIASDDSMENQIMKSEKVGNDTINTRTVFDGVEPQPTEPVTQEPTPAPVTDEPTTAPITDEPTQPVTDAPIDGNTYYLTGSIAGWGPKAEYKFAADGEGQYKLTGIALTTSDMIKGIKTSKSGAEISDWYPDGMDNNITVDHDGTYTVLFRPAGDGTAEDGWIYSWYAGEPGYEVGGGTNHYGYLFKLIDESEPQPTQATDEPTTAPVTDEPTTAPVTDEPTTAPVTDEPTVAPVTDEPTQPAKGLWVVADGKWYAVEKDQVIDYVYYLNDGEQVCSLDGETYYDADGLQWNKQMTWDEDDEAEEYLSKLFPVIKKNMVLNDNVAGRLKYNYSSATGKKFDNDEKQLIHMNFTVTAEEGVYHINTFLHTVAGADEHKYIFKDETLDELKRSEGLLEGLNIDPEPHTDEPTTAPVTDEPTTAPVTDEPTTAPVTDEPTTAPVTDEPTTAPVTDEPTTAPVTDEPTTAPTPTDEPTIAPTPTDEPTVEPTEAAIAYAFEKNPYDYYKGDGGDLVMVVHNTDLEKDADTFSKFVGLTINGTAVVEADGVKFESGSLIITVPADKVTALFKDGANDVAAYFDDAEEAATTVVNIYDGNAPTEAPTDATEATAATNGKSTSDNNGNGGNNGYTVQTGSTEMAIIFLVILVMAAGVVIFTKKRKFD